MEEINKQEAIQYGKRRFVLFTTRLLAILVAVSVIECGTATQNANSVVQNQFEEFRLKLAGNNGESWNHQQDSNGDDLFTLVSQNNYKVDEKTPCFAKVLVCPTAKEMFMMVSNVNLQNTGNVNITANHKTLELSFFESERIKEHFITHFYSSYDTTNVMNKSFFANADSLTFFMCNRKPDMTRLIYFTIDLFHGKDTITFEFETKKSIMDMMMELKSSSN